MESREEYVYADEEPQGMAYPPTTLTRSEKADLLDKINPSAIVETIRHKLMGEELIDGEWVKIKSLQDRALTQKGAWDISNLMLGVSSQNVAISKLKDDEIRERTMNLMRTVQYMCLKNWREYGIKGSDQLYFVHQIVMSNTFITLKQPEGEGIRKLLMGTVTEQRLQSQTENNQKRGGVLNMFRR